jgi:hypothetical protein
MCVVGGKRKDRGIRVRVRGIKATGFSKVVGGLRVPEVEMVSGSEMYTRRGPDWEFSLRLETSTGHGAIRLTLNEEEARDWHMRLSRALASLEGGKS